MKARARNVVLGLALLGLLVPVAIGGAHGDGSDVVPRILKLLSPAERQASLRLLRDQWRDEYAVMVLEVVLISGDASWNRRLVGLLETKTGQRFGDDVDAWFQWLWQSAPKLHPLYPQFKAHLYGLLDPKFRTYFLRAKETTPRIRLDEVRWGGVRQDGIPPLRSPPTVDAGAASYLDDGDVVFGVEVNGDARAYPQRILGWHEMVTDTVGGVPLTGVYCPLCGTMIAYDNRDGERVHTFGTSGFLYRSNKLMYDRETQSLWSTLEGRPVIGSLADDDVELRRYAVVTTTWGEWRRRHPPTRVLALDTGFERDYSAGAAYRDYFDDDELMFPVPQLDEKLPNKADVFGLLRTGERPLAISVRFLAENAIYHETLGDQRLVVLTDRSGASRAYACGDVVFERWDGDVTALDADGTVWTLEEAQLRAGERTLPRMPAQRAFWFGWFSAFPKTRLIDEPPVR